MVEISAAGYGPLATCVDAQYQDTDCRVQRFVENVRRNASVSSEEEIEFLKQIITSADAGRDGVRKAAKQTGRAE